MPFGVGDASGLSTSLGGGAASGGSGSNPWDQMFSSTPAPPKRAGGFRGLFGHLTDPLGAVSALKEFGGGLATTFGTPIVRTGIALGHTADAALGGRGGHNWNEALENWKDTATSITDVPVGMQTGLENLATTGALVAGGPDNPLMKWEKHSIFQPLNEWEAHALHPGPVPTAPYDKNGPQDTHTNIISDKMFEMLDQKGKGLEPTDFWTSASHQGLVPGVTGTALQVAMIAAPAAGVTAGLAGDAAAASDAAMEAGAAAEAAGNAAEATGHLDTALKLANKADRYESMTNVLHNAAHPFKFAGLKTSQLLTAMREQVSPAELPVEPADVHPDVEVPAPVVAATRDTLHPSEAAAEAMAGAHEAGYVNTEAQAHVNPDLLAAMHEATAAAEAQPTPTIEPPAPGTTRLYNGGSGDQTMWTSDQARAQSYAGEGGLRHIDVPDAEAEAMRAEAGTPAHGEAMAAGHQPTTTDYYLTPGELGQFEPVEHPTEPAPEMRPAEKVGAQTEPRKYDTSAGQPVDPEAKAMRDAQLRSETAAAREAVDPPLFVFDQLGQRLQMPTPQWANFIAENLPDSINRLIGRTGANFIDRVRFRNLYRNAMQAMETSQQVARSSGAMRASEEAARILLGPHVGRDVASAMIGEELHARLNGEAFIAEWAKLHAGEAPPPRLLRALEDAARGGYKGIPDATWKELPPEERAQLEVHLNEATKAFRSEAARTMSTLLASRYGAKGLEAALLDPDEVPMSAEQIRLYKRSVRDFRFAEMAKERAVGEHERVEANAARAAADGAKAWGFVEQLRAKLGVTLQTVTDLFRGVPEGMKADGQQVIQLALATVAQEGGALIDVGTGEALRPTSGIYIPLADQFDIPLDVWATAGPEVLHDAIFEPKAQAGQVYDPVALYGGPDAKLAINLAVGADGSTHVIGTVSMSTINGEPIQPWQAHILGSAHEAAAALDFATGQAVPLADSEAEQTLMKHYAGDVMDPNSGLSKWASQRADVAEQLNITPEQLNAEMTMNLWLDHIMEGRNSTWSHGDIFNSTLALAKGEPGLPYLAQTIMDDLTVPEHVDKAMVAADAAGVNKMLAWYYDSHNFIEGAYRGQTMPITGRDAADAFYDVLALSSVMASPTQNLGRALAGFANLDDFLKGRDASFAEARAVVDDALNTRLPNDVVYVRNLGVTEDDLPRLPGEREAAYNRRVARDTERIVGKGEGGTPVSRRWMQTPELRDLSNQTSMTTAPKYRIIDALLGKFNLEAATAEDIGGQPEWWTGNAVHFSDANLAPEQVVHHAGLLGITGPELEAYKQWAVNHMQLEAAREVRNQPDYVHPITDAENGEAKASETAGSLGDNRTVSPAEYQNLARDGRAYIEERTADSSPHVLDDNAVRDSAWESVQHEWSGQTIDAHTGQPIPEDYHGDTYAVTARLKGMKEVNIPIGSNRAAFDRAYGRALKMYAEVLNGRDGHLGVFRNETTGRIEFDPVYNTANPHDTEAVGAYTHAVGGAYHFRSGNGYWIPHVEDHLDWSSKSAAPKAVKASAAQGRALARSEVMRPAYENALMEYHGSGLLAKLRSFRDNLAHPHTSLAVTLDSIMAQLFGFDKTHWGQKGEYAVYADKIRESAAQWSEVAGRNVMPHEVQALLWVYAKRFIGEQDWGRLQAHISNAHRAIDALEQAVLDGKQIRVKNFDPLKPWWQEELQFSRDQLAVRTERKALRMQRTAGTISDVDAARLDYLEKVPTRQASEVQVQTENGMVERQIRNETSYDAKVLSGKEMQYLEYIRNVATPIRQALEDGDFDKARSLTDEYVTARRKSIMGSVEGGEFGPKMVQDPNSVSAQSIARLQYADYVPAPNPEALSTNELLSAFGDKVRGVTLTNRSKLGAIMMRLYSTADVGTLLHEDLHAFRMMAPGDEVAEFSRIYPHIQDEELTPARRADEEQFVQDFMGYLQDKAAVSDPRLSPAMNAKLAAKYRGPMGRLFSNVADVMQQHYGYGLATEAGHAVPNEIVNYWDSIFNADIRKPSVVDDPLEAQYARLPKGVNPEQLRGESPFQFTQRVRQYGEARGQSEVMEQRVRDAERLASKADKFANRMAGLVLEPTRSDIIAQKLEDRASRTLEKIATDMEGAEGTAVPRGWRPYMAALDRIREMAKADPSLEPLLDEIPQNFAASMAEAAKLGFDPTYMPELTWDMAKKYLYDHLRLGTNAEAAGIRTANKGVLSKAGVVDRSLESLGAGTVIATKELLQGRLVQFVEEYHAKQWAPGTAIPEGWRAWEPTRDAIITGHTLTGERVAVNANKIIPDAVYDSLRALQKPAVDMPFRFLWKGPARQVWVNLLLTYSPTWYIKHFIGSTTLAAIEGVRMSDWAKAWKQWKTDTLPDVVRGRDVYAAIDDEMGARGQLIRRRKVSELADVARSEGIKSAAHEFNRKLKNVVTTVDNINRAAVYARTLRTGGSEALAANRAFEALGDFGRLSPTERGMVTSIIPFYAFQKAMFRVLLSMPNDHPFTSAILMQLGQMNEQYMQEKLNGTIPDAFNGSTFIDGRLVKLDKLNPLADSYKMATPEGIATSANPFVRLFAQEALHSPTFNGQASMDANGNLVQSPDLAQTIKETYTGVLPGIGRPVGPGSLDVSKTLSEEQYQKLLKRILKVQEAQRTVDEGGYLVTDVYQPRKDFNPYAVTGGKRRSKKAAGLGILGG